jgi:ATP-dependent helicase YprA (DUF1998 family)
MAAEQQTIGDSITEIRMALQEYIEATYHVGHPSIVAQRRAILEEAGVIFQSPYIESTPRYRASAPFEDLDIPDQAKILLGEMAHPSSGEPPLIHDPPYTHQAAALEAAVRDGQSIVVATGTGSGKTEAFLFPILAKLAIEAQSSESFASAAVRSILLYPMNALVNDQLGRLRRLFGNQHVAELFTAWGGRPARFARYTSRTLYPGVRTVAKDQRRLRSMEPFYLSLLEQASDPGSSHHEQATRLIANLRSRGKWPAKPDLRAWYGDKGQRWVGKDGGFVRAVMRPEDPELLTRHEVLANPPDILVTNYSMLEYMLMRPLERPIFDQTRTWLAQNPDQRLLLVIDEAHMYRGAAGAEVGLLLRRLRSRLALTPERLQVICTSASFSDEGHAREFAAQLTGKQPQDFLTIRGELALCGDAAKGTEADAQVLAGISLDDFYGAPDDAGRLLAIAPFIEHRGVQATAELGPTLHRALDEFPPMAQLINQTMRRATPVAELGADVFATDDRKLADLATTVLIALGSSARLKDGEAGLLPCRLHAFFRGLPGLWACLDPECPAIAEDSRGGPVGKLFPQPQEVCECGARAFELFTCRNCGSAYARAYTDDVESPSFLWNEPGRRFEAASGEVQELAPVDLLLEEPAIDSVQPAELDLQTGRVDPMTLGERTRQIYLTGERSAPPIVEGDGALHGLGASGEFRPCGVCDQQASFGRSSVQDHLTKGDQPFQALVTRQIQVQPPSPQPYSDFAPLRGRKVLVFSDSRQAAARLAPNLQTYSMRDVLRPLILRGWRELEAVDVLRPLLSLEDLHLAVLLGAQLFGVRLRPKLRTGESRHGPEEVAAALERGCLSDPDEMLQLAYAMKAEAVPQALLRGLVATVNDRYYGLQSLALASIRERRGLQPHLLGLPGIPGLAETDEQKIALGRAWIAQWLTPTAGIWFQGMNNEWEQGRGAVKPHAGRFASFRRWLGDKETQKEFEREWLPILLERLCEPKGDRFTIRAGSLALDLAGDWAYCQSCRTTQRPFPGSHRCLKCARDQIEMIDPDHDAVFNARKGYYRESSVRALGTPAEVPMAIIAAEHTAQLNAAQSDEVFSKAEEHELLFQDVEIDIPGPGEHSSVAIDVLSCTTTMEVGIDIGTLSGVALRNMPPSRASYQQRSGRAGRRGDSIATVIAFGSADSHDEHYFSEPDEMIRGPVDDPTLTLDNPEIARRHITAYLFQRYHAARLPEVAPEDQPQLFEVLGTVGGFLSDESPLNRADFGHWLRGMETDLVADVDEWLPTELSASDRENLLESLMEATLSAVDAALENERSGTGGAQAEPQPTTEEAGDAVVSDAPAEVGEERDDREAHLGNLLDRFLYEGILPRYAFPTDVVAFHVFDRENSTRFRAEYTYTPSQGLPIALSQYAPGKRVWIDGKEWKSGALYSPMFEERIESWHDRQLYFECGNCQYATTETYAQADRGEIRECPACGSEMFGPARNWMKPPGFAHPVNWEEETSPDDQPATSYATRAKLIAGGPREDKLWQPISPHLSGHYSRTQLLVTNTGPKGGGYSYCTLCGVIEPSAHPSDAFAGSHPKPYPDERNPTCEGAVTHGLVLGTDFLSDVLLIRLAVGAPLTLRPGVLATRVALRTLAEGLTIAATRRLGIEAGELQAEFRPALSKGGQEGTEAEIYIYDTLAGGAGFSRRVAELGIEVFEDAIELFEQCPASCDRSCYRCLRSFKNRFEHSELDRHLGASLLRYLIRDDQPDLDRARINLATDQLHADLIRQGIENIEFRRDVVLDGVGIDGLVAPMLAESDGRSLIIGIHGPLTPGHASDPALRRALERATEPRVHLVDEIVIAQNLPAASKSVIDALR